MELPIDERSARIAAGAKKLDLAGLCALTSPQPADTYRPLFGRR
jgi:hypothetical protein